MEKGQEKGTNQHLFKFLYIIIIKFFIICIKKKKTSESNDKVNISEAQNKSNETQINTKSIEGFLLY